jgi:uncharacterized protein (DUF58 family)
MVREHLDTSLPRLVLLLDDRPVAHPRITGGTSDSFEAACEAAASIVMAAQREELPLALQTVSGATVGGDGRRITAARPYLDLLAEARLRDGDDGDGDGERLAQATARLRHRRPGDTLIFLTGPGRADDFAQVGSLRGAYPTIIVGALGGTQVGGTVSGPSPAAGMVVLSAADGADFASEWDGVRAW